MAAAHRKMVLYAALGVRQFQARRRVAALAANPDETTVVEAAGGAGVPGRWTIRSG